MADEEVPLRAGDLPPEAFRLIVESTSNPFVVIDRTGMIRFVGASMQRVTGWPASEMLGRPMADFLPPDQRETASEVVAEIDRTDRDGRGIPMVFEILHAGGGTRWVEIGATPLLDVPGIDGIVLRHRAWDAQHHQEEFVRSLLADAPLRDVLSSLARSIALAVEAGAAVVHQGFDGVSFADAVGTDSSGNELPAECLRLETGPWVQTAATGVTNVCELEDLPPDLGRAAAAAGWASLWTTVVLESERLSRSVISVWRDTGGPPLAGHRQALERAARYVQLAVVRTAEHQQLRHLAGHDALTGAENRTEFRDALARALAIGERSLAVAFCDLDGFKAVNDSLGHLSGDQVLVEVADRLRSSLRVGDSLARMGGDEFTVLFRNVPDASAARHLTERLSAALAEPFHVAGLDVLVGISVGVALAEPDVSADLLLRRADEALYRVKRSGGGAAAVWGVAGLGEVAQP
ncbi:MAG: diguanylate cyclase [Acidimicrobiales bacterium]